MDSQSPYVNVFKLCGAEERRDVDVSGKVALLMVSGCGSQRTQ